MVESVIGKWMGLLRLTLFVGGFGVVVAGAPEGGGQCSRQVGQQIREGAAREQQQQGAEQAQAKAASPADRLPEG
ncbi:hypothetical protein [Aeromonas dhakensis]|uniref:hypothetical protein n=1 Tax=Aeromonas dhakensis TaxID=196024 RepID=UPI003C6ECF9F